MASLLRYTNIDGNNIKSYKPGEVILREGQLGDVIYVLLDGAVSVKKADTEILIIDKKGSVLGELSIIAGSPHTATCQAINHVKVLGIKANQEYLEKNPKLLYSIARDLASKLDKTTLTLAETVKSPAIPSNNNGLNVGDISNQLNLALREVGHLVELTHDYAQIGMRLLFADSLGKPDQVRSIMGLGSSDFGVCAFMGSKPGTIPILQEIARVLPETFTQINKEYGQLFNLISGGGNWEGTRPDANTGLMGHWAYGSTRNDSKAYFVTMLNLLRLEGIPKAKGSTFCLNQDGAQNRLGERTDGLVCMGDVFIVFPGGLGTLAELTTIFTSADVNEHLGVKKIIILDPVYMDKNSNTLTRYWKHEIESIIKMNLVGFISDKLAKKINDHTVLYQPCANNSAKEIVSEIISLIIEKRLSMSESAGARKYSELPSQILSKFYRPLNTNSIVRRPFDNHD